MSRRIAAIARVTQLQAHPRRPAELTPEQHEQLRHMIGAVSHVNGSETHLVGSDFHHNNFVALRIHRAQRSREL